MLSMRGLYAYSLLKQASAMTEQEERLLRALADMCVQYLSDHSTQKPGSEPPLDHMCMSAGERAVELLFQYGLVDSTMRHAQWTEKGIALLDERS
jgi:hypothetical protein